MSDVLVKLRGVSLGFQSEVTLKEVNFEIPRRGIFALMGPSGVGKSTLLRTLGRWNDMRPAFWWHGHIELNGQDLREMSVETVQAHIALLAQKARLYTSSVLENAIAGVAQNSRLSRGAKLELAEGVLRQFDLWSELSEQLDSPVVELSIARQRMLAIARLVSGGAECLLADEPLRDVAEEERAELQAFIQRLGKRMAVVLVTHNQQVARDIADQVCLFSGMRLVESGNAKDFFRAPQTALGQTFVELGSCWPDTSDAAGEPAQDAERPSWQPTVQEAAYRPGGFHWVVEGRLGGMQRPGLLGELADDLGALRSMGIRTLVTLTEEPLDAQMLRPYGIISLHFPIVDMDVPELSAAAALCRRMSVLIAAGEPVILHCKAGLGRTGTMLACVLIYRGETAVRAVHRVRSINPLYIQSDRQLQFVAEFEEYCQSSRRSTTADSSGL